MKEIGQRKKNNSQGRIVWVVETFEVTREKIDWILQEAVTPDKMIFYVSGVLEVGQDKSNYQT